MPAKGSERLHNVRNGRKPRIVRRQRFIIRLWTPMRVKIGTRVYKQTTSSLSISLSYIPSHPYFCFHLGQYFYILHSSPFIYAMPSLVITASEAGVPSEPFTITPGTALVVREFKSGWSLNIGKTDDETYEGAIAACPTSNLASFGSGATFWLNESMQMAPPFSIQNDRNSERWTYKTRPDIRSKTSP